MSQSRTSTPGDPELDPTLEEWLAEARDDDRLSQPKVPELDSLLDAVEADIEKAEGRKTFWLTTRPTWMRRLFAGGAALALVGVGALGLRNDFADYPPLSMAVALGALAALLGLATHQALRPLHRPPLSTAARFGVVGLTLAATFTLALLSPHDAHDPEMPGLVQHVSPCLFYGLLMGLPVYLVLRILDRGGTTTALLASCAAGLLGNLALQLHCPRNDVEHLMLAHFSVVALFIGGLGLVQLVLRAIRR